MKIENLSGITERFVDFFFRPDVECAFLSFDMAAVIRLRRGYGGQVPRGRGYNWAVRIFGGVKAAFLIRHITGDLIEDVEWDCFDLLVSRDFERVLVCDWQLLHGVD